MTIGSLSCTLPGSRPPGRLARYAAAFPTAEPNSRLLPLAPAMGVPQLAAEIARWLRSVRQGATGPDPQAETGRARDPDAAHPGTSATVGEPCCWPSSHPPRRAICRAGLSRACPPQPQTPAPQSARRASAAPASPIARYQPYRRDANGYPCTGCLGRRLGRRPRSTGFPAMPLNSLGPELSHYGPTGRAVPDDRLTADAPGVAVQLELPL
jgi:hypothetical protein